MNVLSKYLLVVLLVFSACDIAEIGNSSSSDTSLTNSQNVSTVDIDESGDSEETVAEGENPVCDSVMSVDEKGVGIRWKPESELDGNLVVLFPKEFVKRFLSVVVYTLEGDIEEGSFAGFTNGDRQTWRFSMPGGEYQPRVVVDDGSQSCEWIFPNSSVDQD